MIIVPPGSYNEMLLMWKPVRLQGVGAACSILNANTHPAGKLDPWRRQVNCLFGLALDGAPISGSHPYDPTNAYSCPSNAANNATGATAKFSDTMTTLTYWSRSANNPQIDRLPLEATVGWDATLNGNLAELLQEPTLMGALRGRRHHGAVQGRELPRSNPFVADTFPTGTQPAHEPAAARLPAAAQRAAPALPVPEQLLVQPVEHRRPGHHQQLPGRWRHLRARLGAQPADRQQPRLQQFRHAVGRHQRRSGRIPARLPRRYRRGQRRSGLLPDEHHPESAAAVLLRHERERAPQRGHRSTPPPATSCSRRRRPARAASASAPVPTTTSSTTTGCAAT